MTHAIDVTYPRTLTLQNVAHTAFDPQDPVDIKRRAMRLSQAIRAGDAAPVGPLIQRTRADDDVPSHELLRQASGPLANMPETVGFTRDLRLPDCVLAQFRGAAADLPIVYSKFAVFAYEQELQLSGTFYTVIVDDDGASVRADVFAATRGRA